MTGQAKTVTATAVAIITSSENISISSRSFGGNSASTTSIRI
jgi:hypothetical protein